MSKKIVGYAFLSNLQNFPGESIELEFLTYNNPGALYPTKKSLLDALMEEDHIEDIIEGGQVYKITLESLGEPKIKLELDADGESE